MTEEEKANDDISKSEDDDTDDDKEPEFSDDDFEDSKEYKAFAPLVLTAYKFWLGDMDGEKKAKKGYEWAAPEKDEKPKGFAERAADELRDTQEGKDIIEVVGDGADYYDFVEAIMKFSDVDSKEVAKALDAAGILAIMADESDDVSKAISTGLTAGLTDQETLDVTTSLLKASARRYKRNVDEYNKQKEIQTINPVPYDCYGFYIDIESWLDNQVEQVMCGIVWAAKEYNADRCLYLKIARHLEGIEALESFIRDTLETELKELGVIEPDADNDTASV
jgi:hypothetical protein